MRSPTGSGENLFHIRPFVLDLFEHGEREVVEKVFLVFFSFDFLNEKPSLQPERERSQSCVVLGPESSDTETKDVFEGKYTTLCFQSRCAFKWVLDTNSLI